VLIIGVVALMTSRKADKVAPKTTRMKVKGEISKETINKKLEY